GLIFLYPRIRMSFPVLVEYSAKPYRPFQALPEYFVLTWKYTELVTMADPSGVTAGSYPASVTWKVLPDGLNWRVVVMTRRLAASRSPPADVRLSSRASTPGNSPTLFACHSNASSRPSAVQDRPRESAAPDLKMPAADHTRVDPVLSVITSRSVRAGPFLDATASASRWPPGESANALSTCVAGTVTRSRPSELTRPAELSRSRSNECGPEYPAVGKGYFDFTQVCSSRTKVRSSPAADTPTMVPLRIDGLIVARAWPLTVSCTMATAGLWAAVPVKATATKYGGIMPEDT